MVGKILKHELYAIFRVLVFFAVAVVVFSAAGRILLAVLLGSDSGESGMAGILLFLVVMFYIFSISALIFAAYALGINRFYKTLFTGEGYMTLSLPVTPVQLIWGKLLSSIIAVVAATAVSAVSVVIFMVGWNASAMQMLYDAFGVIGNQIAAVVGSDPWAVAESVVNIIVTAPMILLVIFAVISVGQLFTSHRRAIAFVIFIGIYIAYSIISSLLMPVFADLAESVSMHLVSWIQIAIKAAIDVGCFFLVKYIIKNKVNLIA